MNTLVLSSLAVAMLIIVCSFTETLALGELLPYRNPDYLIELQYPKDHWTKYETLLDPHEIVRFETNEKAGGGGLFFDRPTGFVRLYAYTNDGISLKKMGDSMTMQFRNDTENYRVLNSNLTQISNRSVYQTLLYDYSNYSSFKTLETIFTHGSDFYEVMYTIDPGNFDKYLPEAKKIIESLRFDP